MDCTSANVSVSPNVVFDAVISAALREGCLAVAVLQAQTDVGNYAKTKFSQFLP